MGNISSLAGSSRLLQHFNHIVVTKYLIHLLETLSLGFWVEQGIANCGDEVECKEEVEKGETDVLQSNGGTLCKD
jgi:hypothetical protein